MLTTPILVGTAPVAAATPGAGAAAPCANANVPKNVLRPRPSARFLNCVMLMGCVLLGFSCGVRWLKTPKAYGFFGVGAPDAGGLETAAPAGRAALLPAGFGAAAAAGDSAL